MSPNATCDSALNARSCSCDAIRAWRVIEERRCLNYGTFIVAKKEDKLPMLDCFHLSPLVWMYGHVSGSDVMITIDNLRITSAWAGKPCIDFADRYHIVNTAHSPSSSRELCFLF